MNARCSPAGILAAHAADQGANFHCYRRASGLAVLDFPGPEQPKCLPMPGYEVSGLTMTRAERHSLHSCDSPTQYGPETQTSSLSSSPPVRNVVVTWFLAYTKLVDSIQR